MAGKTHLPVPLAEGAFGAGGEDAASVRHQVGDFILAAQAILQQQHFGALGQPRC
ncbi:hypothetical protein D3C79_924050 [compost metagenome]